MPDLESEKKVVNEVEQFFKENKLEKVCFEIGKYIEALAKEIYVKQHQRQPRNAKVAIDFLIEKKIIDRVTGQKLHVVRTFRNVVAHNLPYRITCIDAEFSIETLNQTIVWNHQGNIAYEWEETKSHFEEGEQYISNNNLNKKNIRKTTQAIRLLFDSLKSATDLKIRHLGIEGTKVQFPSSVKLLLANGIDVRSKAWTKLSRIRNIDAHDVGDGYIGSKRWETDLKAIIPELRNVFLKLDPSISNSNMTTQYPQVKLSREDQV